jgi:hypothetical protein
VSSREERKSRTRAQRIEAERAATRRASHRRRPRWLIALLGGATVA